MVKIKAKSKNGRLCVKARLSHKDEISIRELEKFSKQFIRGFLKPSQGKMRTLEYIGPESISLLDYLKNPISKYEFFYILAQVVEAPNRLKNNNLFLNKLVLDLRYVFINRMTREVHFIYLPVVTSHYCVDMMSFIEAIVYSIVPNPNENTEYVAQFMCFIKNLKGFSAEDIQSYIASQDRGVVAQMKKQNMGQSGFITDKPKDYYAHYEENNEATSLLNEDVAEEGTALLDQEGTALLDDEEGTSLLQDNSANYYKVHFPSLQRISTNETITINKPVFRLGKEKSYVDYFVSNNNAVSRSHADIITRGTHYFVYDHNSKNNTYINNETLPVKEEIEIFDGNLLRLANEEFIFHI